MQKLLIILFIFTYATSTAQNINNEFLNLQFKPFAKNDALPFPAVFSIVEDEDGLMWFGTTDGLCRNDGYRLKSFYTNRTNKDGLSDNTVTGLIKFNYSIYTSSNEGTSYYDGKQKKFHQLDTVLKTNINKDFRLTFLKQEKRLLAFGINQFYSIDEKNIVTNISIVYSDEVINKSFAGVQMKGGIEDSRKKVWIFSLKNLLQLNPVTFTVEKNIESKNLGLNEISSIVALGNEIWISSYADGIKCYNTLTKKLTNVTTKSNSFEKIILFKDVNNNNLILAGGYKGYCIINPKTLSVENFEFEYRINDFFVDKKNTIWIGTDKGVFYGEQNKKVITSSSILPNFSFTNLQDQKEEYVKNSITTNNYYYQIAASGNFAAQFDKKWNFIKTIPSNFNDTAKISIGGIRSIYETNDYYWITSWSKGLAKCTKDFKVLKWFPKNIPDNINLNGDSRSFMPIGKDSFFVRGYNSLSIFNSKEEKFIKTFYNKSNIHALPNGLIPSAVMVGNDCYFGTERIGFFKLNFTTGEVNNIPLQYNNLQISKIIRQDSLLWISTNNGLVKYNIYTKNSTTFFRAQGLCNEKIYVMELSEKTNTLWMCTYGGIIAFNTKTNKVNNYFNKDGLYDHSNLRAIFIDDSDKIFVSNGNYVSVIDPKILEENTVQKKSIITELLINNENADWIFDKESKFVKVKNNKNNIALHFTVANATDNEMYFYKLNGSWFSSTNGFLQFNNLAPGEYKIYVANQPKDAAINDFIIINIRPPFYNTWWFYALCFFGIGCILFAFFKIRTNNIRKEALLQKTYEQKLVESEMQTLRSQMNPHFVFNTLNSINSYIIQNKTTLASEYLTTFSKLMRSILDLSKQEIVSLEKEVKALKMYIELEALRLENKFDYSIIVDKNIDDQSLKIPSLMLQPFVENAIWHGLHNKNDQGSINIKINQINPTQIIVTIEDDGIGRVAAAALKQAQISHKSYGIDITKNRLQLLNKNNTVTFSDLYDKNNKATGTKVTITINTTYND